MTRSSDTRWASSSGSPRCWQNPLRGCGKHRRARRPGGRDLPRVRPARDDAGQTAAQVVAVRLAQSPEAWPSPSATESRALAARRADPDNSTWTRAPIGRNGNIGGFGEPLDRPSRGNGLSCQGPRCRDEVTHSNRMQSCRGCGRGTVRGTGRWIIPAQRVPSVRYGVSCVQRAGMGARSRASHNPPVVDSSPTRPTRNFTGFPHDGVERFVERMSLAGLSCCHAEGRQRSHRATTERVVPSARLSRDRSAHQTRDPLQIHRQDRAGGTSSSAGYSRKHPKARCPNPMRPWRSCWTSTRRSPGGICPPGKATSGRVHPADHQASPRIPAGAQGPGPLCSTRSMPG